MYLLQKRTQLLKQIICTIHESSMQQIVSVVRFQGKVLVYLLKGTNYTLFKLIKKIPGSIETGDINELNAILLQKIYDNITLVSKENLIIQIEKKVKSKSYLWEKLSFNAFMLDPIHYYYLSQNKTPKHAWGWERETTRNKGLTQKILKKF